MNDLTRGLIKELNAAECEIVRHGHGSHTIWRSPSNVEFVVPHVVKTPHLSKRILKQAGLK